MLGSAFLLTSPEGQAGGCASVRRQTGTLTRSLNSCARLGRGCQAATGAGQQTSLPSTQGLSSSTGGKPQAERAAAGQAQAQEGQPCSLALGGLDDSAHQCSPRDAHGAGSPGAGALSRA